MRVLCVLVDIQVCERVVLVGLVLSADTNAPEEDHWWAIMAGEVPIPDHIPREQATMLVKPDNWNFYIQPSAMIEEKNDKGEVLVIR